MTSPMTEAALQTLKVRWIGPTLNKIYAGVHWRERTQWADTGHTALWAAVVEAKTKPVTGPVHLTFTPHMRGRKYDTMNYVFTAKILEDGLVREGILKGDTPRYVRSVTMNAPVRTKEQSYMMVAIEKVGS